MDGPVAGAAEEGGLKPYRLLVDRGDELRYQPVEDVVLRESDPTCTKGEEAERPPEIVLPQVAAVRRKLHAGVDSHLRAYALVRAHAMGTAGHIFPAGKEACG